MNKDKIAVLLSSVDNGFEEVAIALIMRANYIETGDVSICRADVAASVDAFKESQTARGIDMKVAIRRIVSLSDEQHEMIKKLRVLAEAFRSVR